MQPDSREKLDEEPAIGDMQPIPLTGARPTRDRMRVEAEEDATREKRRQTLTRVAIGVVVISLLAIGGALLGL
jgi:hypothetical protein